MASIEQLAEVVRVDPWAGLGLEWRRLQKRLGISDREMWRRYYRGGALLDTALRSAGFSKGEIQEMDFGSQTVRVRNCLRNDGIHTISQLRRVPDERLLRIPNFGLKSLIAVRERVPRE